MATAITNIRILVGNEVAPEGYNKIPVNLNEGTNGKPLFLAYKQDKTQQDAQSWITALDVIEGQNAVPPPGWTKDSIDLNAGAGGNWLYLTYKKSGNEPPITDIQIKVVPSEPELILPSGYRYIRRDLNQGAGGNWVFLIYRQEFHFDPNPLIPLSSASYREHEFVAKLTGSAIKGDEEYEIHFDTGSWTLSIPYDCLEKSKLTVVEQNVKDSWGKPADKVKGEIALKSHDGNTTYSIKDYVFFARKQDDGSDAPCDRSDKWGNSIMGAFPSAEPGTGLESLPYALAKKYSQEKKLDFGIGIISQDDKSYLLLGDDQKVKTYSLKWRTDIPNWHKDTIAFCPEAVPGFTIRLKFTKLPEPQNEIKVPELMATIDTGASEMVLRLGKENPQNTEFFSAYFTTEGYWKPWNSAVYNRDAKMVTGDCIVTVEFKDSHGDVSSYSFEANNTKNKVAVGAWNGEVPWGIKDPQMPQNRFNLGNTIYRYCPILFYDIKNKRVGILFGENNS